MFADITFLHIGKGFPQSPVLANFLTRPYPSSGKDKIEHFHVLWHTGCEWRTSQYAIVKVDVTESNDVTKRHGIVITIWRTSAIEMTALSKTHVQKWKICKKKNPSWVWGINRKIRPSGLQSDITRQASWCQTATLGRFFLSTSHTHDGFLYSCSPDKEILDLTLG